MNRVLVTGGSGFVGKPVLGELVRRGHEVHAIVRQTSPAGIEDVTWHPVDLGDDAQVLGLMRSLKPSRLVHLAWNVAHGQFWNAPENVLWVERSLRLLRTFANSGGRRALILGSCAEYDWSQADAPLNEASSPLHPATLYGVTKDALRRVASSYAASQGFELAWGRLFFLYGPHEHPARLVSSVVRALLVGERVDTTSGGQLRDFLYVEDVAAAVAAVLDSPVEGAVNIASGVGVSVSDVIDSITAVTGGRELVRRGSLAEHPTEPPKLVADVTRLRDEVGFQPRWGLSEGIADTVRWCSEHL